MACRVGGLGFQDALITTMPGGGICSGRNMMRVAVSWLCCIVSARLYMWVLRGVGAHFALEMVMSIWCPEQLFL